MVTFLGSNPGTWYHSCPTRRLTLYSIQDSFGWRGFSFIRIQPFYFFFFKSPFDVTNNNPNFGFMTDVVHELTNNEEAKKNKWLQWFMLFSLKACGTHTISEHLPWPACHWRWWELVTTWDRRLWTSTNEIWNKPGFPGKNWS